MTVLRQMSLSSRRLVLASALYFGIYAACVGLLALGAWSLGFGISALRAPELRESHETMQRLSMAYLAVGCVGLAVLRLAFTHPAFHPKYRQWLSATPWQLGQPLPLGSPLPGVVDFVLLGILGSYALVHLPIGWVVWLMALYPITYAGCALVPILNTTSRPLTAHFLALLLLASVLVTFLAWTWVPIATALVMLAVAWHGVRLSLKHFARQGEADPADANPKEQPYLSGVEPIEIPPPTRWDTALFCCAFVAYWVGVVTAVSTQLTALYVIVFGMCIFVRLGLYLQYTAAPISLWGRLRRWRWIVPGYDIVFVAPLLTLLACPAAVAAGLLLKLPGPVTAGLTAFITLLILVKGGPSRRRWRLTGNYRVATPRVQTRGRANG